jgi:pyridoxal phosphate enzyme (YggS family)
MNREKLDKISAELKPYNAALVAVSKTKPVAEIKKVYDCGHKIFGENYVQELAAKQSELPRDIQWHFIGHLQSKKVKQIAPFISLIHAVDGLKLLKEINEQAKKNNRIIDCLLQIHIAKEETKFGLAFQEAETLIQNPELAGLKNICIKGLMGMATLTDNENQIRKEFRSLAKIFKQLQATSNQFQILSMGMTSDYKIALEEGSTMVRIGSAIFGERIN